MENVERQSRELVFQKSYGDNSFGNVYLVKNKLGEIFYEVWEIPMYGGEEIFYKDFCDFNDAVLFASSFA